MKNKKYWVLAAMLVICASVLWAANKTDSQISPEFTALERKDTLKGLQGVFVAVEAIKPEIEKYGLTKQQLQTDVELQLLQNGIKVLSEPKWFSMPGMPYLYVNVTAVISEGPQYVAYSISLHLNQNTLLLRDITKGCVASTWHMNSIGSVGLSKITTIREAVKDHVDMFISDYLAVNPKR